VVWTDFYHIYYALVRIAKIKMNYLHILYMRKFMTGKSFKVVLLCLEKTIKQQTSFTL